MIDKIFQLINLPNTYIGEAPIGIDQCQWLKETAGETTIHFNKQNFDKPSFSIYVRGVSNQETLQRTKQLFITIRNYSDAIGAIVATRLPSFVGKDDKHRSIYVFQFQYQTGGY